MVEMAIIENQLVETKWVGRTKKYYESKGYVFTKKNDIFLVRIEDLQEGSNVKVFYICDYCNGERQTDGSLKRKSYTVLNNNKKNNVKDCCNKCKGTKTNDTKLLQPVSKGKSLGELFPELVNQWSTKNEFSIFNHTAGSGRVVWWNCTECKLEWETAIANRVRGTGCPFCSGRKATSTNCLKVTNPTLAELWDYEKNYPLTPLDVKEHSNLEVFWKCLEGHEWKKEIAMQNSLKTIKCPVCNSVGYKYPHLIKEWCNTLNNGISIFNVHYGSSSTKYWWTCEKNHKWKSSVCNRTKAQGCPICKESKGEKRVREFLEKTNINFIPQYEFDKLLGLGGKPLKFDFAVLNSMDEIEFLIEYDGIFHYKKQYQDDAHEKIIEHDRRKNTFCISNDIPLLRIPYWEFENTELIISTFINHNQELKINNPPVPYFHL